MPLKYPINSHQPIVPCDGPPTSDVAGMLGQIAVDVNANAYYQRIGSQWYPVGSGPVEPVLTTFAAEATINSSPADGASLNSVKVTAQDQNGQPYAVSVSITMDSTSALPQTGAGVTNGSTGEYDFTFADSEAHDVVVTASGGGKTATATVTFVAVQEGVRVT